MTVSERMVLNQGDLQCKTGPGYIAYSRLECIVHVFELFNSSSNNTCCHRSATNKFVYIIIPKL